MTDGRTHTHHTISVFQPCQEICNCGRLTVPGSEARSESSFGLEGALKIYLQQPHRLELKARLPLQANAASLGLDKVLYGDAITAQFGNNDLRKPSIIGISTPGVIYDAGGVKVSQKSRLASSLFWRSRQRLLLLTMLLSYVTMGTKRVQLV